MHDDFLDALRSLKRNTCDSTFKGYSCTKLQDHHLNGSFPCGNANYDIGWCGYCATSVCSEHGVVPTPTVEELESLFPDEATS